MSIDVHHLILSDDEVTAIEHAAAQVEAVERTLLAFGVDLPAVELRPARVLNMVVNRCRYGGHSPIRLIAETRDRS